MTARPLQFPPPPADRGRSYPPEAVLTAEQVAEWLQVGVGQVQRMNLPAVAVGKRRWRYIAGQVLDELKRRAE